MRILGLALLLAGGCAAKDPCEGESGICIGATIEGNVSGLDQLRLTIDQPVARTVTTPNPPSGFSLPVKVALVLPAAVTGSFSITVEGLSGGQAIASTGAVVLQVPGQRASHTFTLTAGNSPLDLSMPPPDLTPGGVVAMPNVLTFPSTPRGSKSAVQKMTITNFGDTPVNALSFMDTGDSGFDVDGATSTCTMQLNLAPQESCILNWLFAPTKPGALMKSTEVSLSTAQKLILTLNGTATSAWTLETVPGPTPTLLAVHGSSSGDVWAVGNHTALTVPAAYHTTGNGNWDGMSSGIMGTPSLNAVFVVSPTEVYAGGRSIVRGDSTRASGTWVKEDSFFTSENVKAMWGSGGEVFAVGELSGGSPLFVHRSVAGAWATEPVDVGDGGALVNSFMYAVTGFTSTSVVALGGAGNGYSRSMSAWRYIGQLPGASEIRGAWSQPNTVITWAVDDGGRIFKMENGMVFAETSGVSMPLSAIHGRGTGGNTEIFAVGAIGSKVLRSSGNGTWTPQPIPTTQAMNAVYVAPDGHVFAVGFDGQIAHYY
jgi:hypothetical protein